MIKTFKRLKNNAAANSKLRHLTDEEVRKLQAVLLAMLKDFHQICEKYQLVYFLTGGSALGAARHHGFIPWDDDIDVIMPRDDYERLAECVEKEMPQMYWIQNIKTCSVYDLNFSKFRKLGTKYIELFDNETEKAGIGIDIFPLDNTYKNPLINVFYGAIDEFLFLASSCVRMYQKKDRLMNYIQDEKLLSIIRMKIFLGGLLNDKKDFQKWYRRCEAWCVRAKNKQSKYAVVSSGRGHFFGEQYIRKAVCPPVLDSFEGETVYVAKDNHYLLRVLYGQDYMTPPKDGNRESHSLLEIDFGTN